MPIKPGLLVTAILAMIDETTKEMYLSQNPDLEVLLEEEAGKNTVNPPLKREE